MLTRITSVMVRHSRLLVLVAACLFGTILSLGGVTMGLEAQSGHLREKVMAKNASGKTVIIALDDKSLKEVQAWPWPRSIHGQLVERLRKMQAGNVVFDVSFTTNAADPKQDQLFAQSLKRAGGRNTLLAITDVNDGDKQDALPVAPLLATTTPATGWISIDDDGVISLPRGLTISGRKVGSLSTELAGVPAGGKHYEPDWSIRYSSIPVISYADVLKGRVTEDQIRGKNVIIGATAQSFGDQWAANDGFRISGVFIHALGAETLMHRAPVPAGPIVPAAVMAAMLGLCLLVRNRILGSVMIAVSFAGIVGLTWLIQEHTGYVATIGAAGMITVIGIAAQISASTVTFVMKRLTTDTITDLPNLAGMRIDEPEGANTVAVRLHNKLETISVLGIDLSAELLRRIRDRIKLVAGDAQIYQVDEHSFAWRTHLEGAQLSETLEGLGALFGSGVLLDGRTIDTPISAGIAERHPGNVLESVNAALLAAEHAARQGLPWTRHVDADADTEWRLTMMGELETALKDGDVWVAYQSKWSAQDTSVCTGAEALVRWTHKSRGPIRPDQFIPMLEEGGRIDGLTSYVLDTAIRDFAPFEDMGVAVNLSTRLLGKGKIVATVKAALAKHGMAASRLTLEITESASLDGDDSIRELVELDAMGVKISIDDYGTGQSTLTYVRKLPAKELKIDQSFVRAMLTSRSDELMIASTIELSHQLGLDVVAEGVETQGEADALKALGCDILQGYHLGRPVSLVEFMARHAADLVKKKRRA